MDRTNKIFAVATLVTLASGCSLNTVHNNHEGDDPGAALPVVKLFNGMSSVQWHELDTIPEIDVRIDGGKTAALWVREFRGLREGEERDLSKRPDFDEVLYVSACGEGAQSEIERFIAKLEAHDLLRQKGSSRFIAQAHYGGFTLSINEKDVRVEPKRHSEVRPTFGSHEVSDVQGVFRGVYPLITRKEFQIYEQPKFSVSHEYDDFQSMKEDVLKNFTPMLEYRSAHLQAECVFVDNETEKEPAPKPA